MTLDKDESKYTKPGGLFEDYPDGMPEHFRPLWDEFVKTWRENRETVAGIHAKDREKDPSLPENWVDCRICTMGWVILMKSPLNEKRFAALYAWTERA